MNQIQTIYRWIKSLWPGWLESALFEELFARFPKEKAEGKRRIYEEFCRRLSRLVYLAAMDYAKRKITKELEVESEELKNRIFRTFVPEVAVGEPGHGLRRFATCIRSILDEEAFSCIARAFYYQLPLYHLSDAEERKFLAVVFQEQELSTPGDTTHRQLLAERFQVSPEHAERVIKRANRHLEEVIANDFEDKELQDLTEGYVLARKGLR